MGDDPQAEPHYTKTYVATDSDLTVLLYNSDVGAARLKPAHQQYLKTNLPQYLSLETTATIVGLASPTGTRTLTISTSPGGEPKRCKLSFKASTRRDIFSPSLPFTSARRRRASRASKTAVKMGGGGGFSFRFINRRRRSIYDRLWIYDASIQEFRDMVTANDRPNTS